METQEGASNARPSPLATPWWRRPRWIAVAAVAAAVAVTLGTVQFNLRGRFYGLYLLTRESGRPLEVKDDLKLGDGPRLVGGVSLAWLRNLRGRDGGRLPRLEVDWDEKEGEGVVTNHLEDGRVLQTVFSRYLDSDSKTPRGLFVGGAIAEVAAVAEQNQSGMAIRDARGWQHVWCSVNEALAVEGRGALVFPSDWRFAGSRLLVDAPEHVVIMSEHELTVGTTRLRMTRFARFKAGRTWFRLGVDVMNVGEGPTRISYAYGDEPWVGEYGSAAGNFGWTADGIVTSVAFVDPRAAAGGGIVDGKTGLANFIGWADAGPDNVFFGNHPGTPLPAEVGQPLASNEVFIGLEWLDRTIDAGDSFAIQLALGVADTTPGRLPRVPERAVRAR